ncbi:MAG: PAS domain-containing protein, partial [Ktedonobacteraceae bacterium]|nr:PAS domain-containing protein [Ktedonobacteraceae bacterium]
MHSVNGAGNTNQPTPRQSDAENIEIPTSQAHRNVESVPAAFTREYHILSEVCSSMSSGFMLLNQQRVIYTNPSALRLLRISKQDLIAEHDFDVRKHLLSLSAEPHLARSELDSVWQHPEEEFSTDVALADAAVRWLRIRSFPVRNNKGILLGRGVLFDDITLERSLIESRGETLALAAHELKTPLAIIKGCATTLLGSSARWDPAMQREMLSMIDTQSDRLHDVLNTLLDVWRLDAGAQPLRLAQVRIPELLQQLLQRRQVQASDHYFVLELPSPVRPMVCDAMRIEQALNHLLNNAITYSPSGTTITVKVEANDVELRIGVTDEGIGIAPEHLEPIFDRFYRIQQGDESGSSSGLGLASARATIEAHGGKIWADSLGADQGSTFYFTLPFTPHVPTLAQPATLVTDVTGNLPSRQQGLSRSVLLKQDRRI